MLVTETLTEKWIDGSNLIKTYSDIHHYIERDGVKYVEAVDPESLHRTYTETDEEIPDEPTPEPEPVVE